MSGASGPTMTVQTPSAPFVIGCGFPSSSPLAVTCVAFGARYRRVRVRSAPISGEITTGPRGPPRPGAARPPGTGAPAGGAEGVWAVAAVAGSDRARMSVAVLSIQGIYFGRRSDATPDAAELIAVQAAGLSRLFRAERPDRVDPGRAPRRQPGG